MERYYTCARRRSVLYWSLGKPVVEAARCHHLGVAADPEMDFIKEMGYYFNS